jgi:hypothetical protein
MMFRVASMEAVRTSETSVDNHFTRQYIPEDTSMFILHILPCKLWSLSGFATIILHAFLTCLVLPKRRIYGQIPSGSQSSISS